MTSRMVKGDEWMEGVKEKIFYVKEFLEMIGEFQAKKVFGEMIEANVFGMSKVQGCTRNGFYKRKELLKEFEERRRFRDGESGKEFCDYEGINLKILKKQNDLYVPTMEEIEMMKVSRNYECLSCYREDKN